MTNLAWQDIVTPDGRVRGSLCQPKMPATTAPLLVCIHGSGCNSRYFDLSHNSLALEATRRGFPVLLVDRPGHGGSVAPGPGSAIDRSAEAVVDLVEAAQRRFPDLRPLPIALIGHSFGGAVALTCAAKWATSPLAALCVSGIGDQPNADYAAMRLASLEKTAAKPAPYWLFGPGSSYDWRGVTALRATVAPWRADEVEEIVHLWPARWAKVVSAVTCAVHVRLAEFERIWEATPTAIDRIATAFSRAKRVDAAIAPDGGHLYEAHLRGPELIAAQLGFARDAAAALA